MCDLVNQRELNCFETGGKTKELLFFLLIKKVTALLVEMVVIGEAVGHFGMCDMTPFCDITSPLVGGTHCLST